MRLSDSSWHEECLFCSQCHCPLVNSCYYRDGKLFCRVDYERSVHQWRGYTRFSDKMCKQNAFQKTNIRIFNFLESFDINRTLSHQSRIVSTYDAGAGSELLLVNLNFK